MHGTLCPSFLQRAKQNKYANTVPAKHPIVLTMQVPKKTVGRLWYTLLLAASIISTNGKNDRENAQ
jgi:hypothetical protein